MGKEGAPTYTDKLDRVKKHKKEGFAGARKGTPMVPQMKDEL